jgi:acrylyl-CoA reductase (NADPH)
MALEAQGLKPGAGEVLVTGASGGVGSVAVALLSKLGYEVVAATGKAEEEGYLRQLGARTVIDRSSLSAPGKPLQKERWAGVVDAVGSHTLANACAQTRYGGAVAACGLAQGADLPASVMPFILRGVSLLGVDSVMAPLERRQRAWQRLARDLDLSLLETMITEITIEQAVEYAQALMQGKVRGRIVVKI